MQHGRLQRKRAGLDPAKDGGAEGHIGASGLHILGHAKDCAIGDLGCFDYIAFGLGDQQRAVRRLLCELSRCPVLRDLSSESVNFRYRGNSRSSFTVGPGEMPPGENHSLLCDR